MNLDNVTVELRPRTEWEAVDLGARMVRRDAKTIYASWFAITLPLFLLASAGIWFTEYPGWSTFAYWWFEPLTDGVILHIISRRLFGEQVGLAESLRQTFRLAWRNIIFLLPPYRFHFARSVAMPITQLEGLKGARRRARATVINNRVMNYGTGVTVAYQHLFLSLYFGVYLMVFALVPTAYQSSIGFDWLDGALGDGTRAALIAQLVFLYVAQTALHPWFVGAGFGLYINCRTQLEAWDIEVSFRRMVSRRGLGTTAVAILLFALPLTLLPGAATAQDEPAADTGFAGYWGETEVQEALTEVLKSEALDTSREDMVWRRKDRDEEAKPDDDSSLDLSFLEKVGKAFAVLVELWLWLIVGILLFLLYMTRAQWLPYLADLRRPRATTRRVVLADGEITADLLPEDIPAEVRKLWQGGHKREALSLLFRGSVFNVVMQHGVRVPPSATEGACVDAVSRQGDENLAAYFQKVVMTWVWFAYGAREPGDETLLELCAEWPEHYGEQR